MVTMIRIGVHSRAWPLQEIRLFIRELCTSQSYSWHSTPPCLPPPRCILQSLLRNIWYSPGPSAFIIQHTRLVMAISCKGQSRALERIARFQTECQSKGMLAYNKITLSYIYIYIYIYIYTHTHIYIVYTWNCRCSCACTRVCWCRRIFTYIHIRMFTPALADPSPRVKVYVRVHLEHQSRPLRSRAVRQLKPTPHSRDASAREAETLPPPPPRL